MTGKGERKMDARLTYEQMGEQMWLLLGDYAGEAGAEAFWRAKDICEVCAAVRQAIRGAAC